MTNEQANPQHDTAIVAFSGGLDTSMLVPYMREEYKLKNVITCIVDTGLMTQEMRDDVEKRANEVGSDEHIYINAAQAYYDEII